MARELLESGIKIFRCNGVLWESSMNGTGEELGGLQVSLTCVV